MRRRTFIKAGIGAVALESCAGQLLPEALAGEPAQARRETENPYSTVSQKPLYAVMTDFFRIYAKPSPGGSVERVVLTSDEALKQSRDRGYTDALTEADVLLRLSQDRLEYAKKNAKPWNKVPEFSVRRAESVRGEVSEMAAAVEERLKSSNAQTAGEKALVFCQVFFGRKNGFAVLDQKTREQYFDRDTESIFYYNPTFYEVWNDRRGVCEDLVGAASTVLDVLRRRGVDVPMQPVLLPGHAVFRVVEPGKAENQSTYVEMTKTGRPEDHVMSPGQYQEMLEKTGIGKRMRECHRPPQPFTAVSAEAYNHSLKIIGALHADSRQGAVAEQLLRFARGFSPMDPEIPAFLGLAYLMQACGRRFSELQIGEDCEMYVMDMRDEVSQSLRDIGLISRNETYVENVYAHGEERRKVIMVIEDSKSKQRRRLLALKERVGGKDAVRLTKEGAEGGGILLRLDASDSIHGTAYLLPEKSERERMLRFAGYSIERALSLDSNSSTTAKFDGELHMELAGFHPEKRVEHLERAARGFRNSLRLSHENGEINERDGMALFREHLGIRSIVDIYEQLFVATGDKKYLEEVASFYDSRWITPSIRHYCSRARGDLLMRLSGLAATPEERGGTVRRASQAYGDAIDSVRKHGDFMGGSAEVFVGAYALRKGAVEVSYDGKASESSFREGLKALGYKGGYTLDGLIERLEKTQYKHDSTAERDKRYTQMKSHVLPVLREIRKSEEASKVFGGLLQSPAE